MFLSSEAFVALGMITEHFPTISETAGSSQIAANNVKDITMETNEVMDVSSHTECGYSKRETPPPIPTNLPYPRADLQQYLLDRYKSSTFNTCEHQSLQLMAGPLMQLMVDSNATPVAHHTPVLVPLHWQEEVKAGLDQDVSLGVTEPVPVGDPVTWCHRMVVCAKKNGKPRRTVDFQALNAHAIPETHHTQSPFHQARSVSHGTKR